MKFSIVIPVYNVEEYIAKCLDSIKNQTYDNYEVIIVNDGTKDNSVDIIKKYLKDKRFSLYEKENGGLSDARNYGVKYISGDYLLFLDSDDYIEYDLLEHLNNILTKKEYDLIKYKVNFVDTSGNLIRHEEGNFEGKAKLNDILAFELSEPAWSYCYKASFFIKNKFKYSVGRIHEDFGLTPYILVKTNNIYITNYYGYNYVQRMGSIVNGAEKNVKRCNDVLYHFDHLYDIISKDKKIDNDKKKIIYSYLANGLIIKASLLNGQNLNNYIKELRKRHIFNYLLEDNIKRKIKKLVIKICPKLYIKLSHR